MQGLKVQTNIVHEIAMLNEIVDGRMDGRTDALTHRRMENRMPMPQHASRCNKI